MTPNGYRKVKFKDGQTIVYNHHNDNIYNLSWGVMGHQMFGRLEFKDEEHNIKAFVDFAADSSREQDYIAGEIR